MVNRKYRVVGLIALVAGTVFWLLMAVRAGLHLKWITMSIFLIFAVLFVIYCTSALLALKIESCFRHLENLISKKSSSVRPIMTASNWTRIHRVNKVIEKIVLALMVISTPVYVFLGAISALRQDWFWMAVLLFGLIITDVICIGVLTALKIDACSKRLEELISRGNEGQTSTEQRGE